MSWNPAIEPLCPDNGLDHIETLVIPRARDLGGFEVRRALPSKERQMVGPFIFFDQMGPAEFLTGAGIDVRPHPHIGLATVTYLLKGEFQHRDSLGSNQMIYPGEVNWMIAGNGITHSERTSAQTRSNPHSLFGIQTWVALPKAAEDTNPQFQHVNQGSLPVIESEGKTVRLILGRCYGETVPVKTFSDMFYADAVLNAGTKLPLPHDHEDRAVYILEGTINVSGVDHPTGELLIFRPGDAITLTAGPTGARLMLLGGETLTESRYIWWNFVSSDKARIEAAREAWRERDWQNGRFSLPPDDDDEFTPLPDRI